MNNLRKSYLELSTLGKFLLLILTGTTLYFVCVSVFSPTILNTITTISFLLLCISNIIVGYFRPSHKPKIKKLWDSLWAMMFVVLLSTTIPLLVFISILLSDTTFIAAFKPLRVMLLLSLGIYTFIYFLFASIVLEPKPKDIIKLRIKDAGGGVMKLIGMTGKSWIDLPIFGIISLDPVTLEHSFGIKEISKGAFVNIRYAGELNDKKILSITTGGGTVVAGTTVSTKKTI